MRKITLLLALMLFLTAFSFDGDRNRAIEIHFNDSSQIPVDIRIKYDIEFSSKEGCEILWVHPDEWKKFDYELFDYLGYVTKVYNRVTGTDHINLYIKSDTIDEYGVEINGIKYKNIKWSEIGTVEIDSCFLQSEIDNLNY